MIQYPLKEIPEGVEGEWGGGGVEKRPQGPGALKINVFVHATE